MMDLDALRLTVDVVQFVAIAGAWLYVLAMNRQKATAAQIDDVNAKLTARCEQLVVRLTSCEAQLQSAPTRDAVHELAVAIEHLGGDLKATASDLKGLRDLVKRLESVSARMEDFLLRQGQKS